jgi:LacI family transcriptional regulator/LacI family purine nucleotide synthesis repressor
LADHFVINPNSPHFNFQAGFNACREAMERSGGDKPTALVCYNDELALGALSALNDAGVRVPDEVSVVGNDNIPYASFSVPTLTTSAVPRAELAQAAIDTIDHWVDHHEVRKYDPFVPVLKVRRSTGKTSNE